MKKSYKIILAYCLSFIFAGIIEGLYPDIGNAFAITHIFLLAFLLFWWCGVHAEENDMVPVKGAKFLSGFISFVGVPYYFYTSYGFKEGSFKILKALAILVFSGSLYSMSLYVAQNF